MKYGPDRIYSEFKIWQRFVHRQKRRNIYIPPRLHSGQDDPFGREWVPGVFVGLKKTITILELILGFSVFLYL
ncbi:hypothetical protein SAMN05660236_4450 [Ohtaekwangia koreensis]|uniref:Uncharacterized protein n=1 Tax=Ohtaekwangia koreensis TaxID=688867 RepID=A0A1T5M5A5_9BACT|nr:hypothetical protein SAMN05660236_4450 [Ohtaekwangia koreensis]